MGGEENARNNTPIFSVSHSKGTSMNSWLQKMHSKLYSELDSLQVGHPSGRDNGRWIAEVQGKLDACTLLKDTPIDALRIDEVRRAFDSESPSNIEQKYIEHYRKGVSDFINDVTKKLSNASKKQLGR